MVDYYDPNNPSSVHRFPFGKYKERTPQEVPVKYLLWFVGNVNPDHKYLKGLIFDIHREIEFRSDWF